MKIAIHKTKHGFDGRWIEYCKAKGIAHQVVDCHRNDIIQQLGDCDALMWHINHGSPKDNKMAKPLLFALQQSGMTVFPDFNTGWHFDDKLGQKYLLESLGVPLVPTWIFYDRSTAMEWVNSTGFPKVFKLRGGAGSANVQLVHTSKQAAAFVKTAFGRGFAPYNAWGNFKDRWRLYRKGKSTALSVLKGAVRFFNPPPAAKMAGREKGYIYFQEFIQDNDHDIRVVVVGDRAFAIKRMVRENDFRASGSGFILYDKSLFDEKLIRLSFDIAAKLHTQVFAVDYIFDKHNNPLVVEFSFGFSQAGYEKCEGYWDKNMNWHAGSFNPQEWMIADLIQSLKNKQSQG